MQVFLNHRILFSRQDAGLDSVLVPILLAGTLVVALVGVLLTNLALTPGYDHVYRSCVLSQPNVCQRLVHVYRSCVPSLPSA